jgi:hypothetical protein
MPKLKDPNAWFKQLLKVTEDPADSALHEAVAAHA